MYFFEPMAILITIILIIGTANTYIEPSATNFDRAIFTGACLIYFPIVLIILVNSIVKKGGLPHNTWTKTHLELDKAE